VAGARGRIPAAIWISAASLFAAIAALAFLTAEAGGDRPGWAQIAFAALLGALILGGLLGRRRLAWLWGHYLSLFLGVIQGGTLAYAVARGSMPLVPGLLLGAVVAALLVAFWSLGRRSSLEYFDLVCPGCGTPSRMGADFLFRQARCRKCGNVW
jgi:hypothetical protein